MSTQADSGARLDLMALAVAGGAGQTGTLLDLQLAVQVKQHVRTGPLGGRQPARQGLRHQSFNLKHKMKHDKSVATQVSMYSDSRGTL